VTGVVPEEDELDEDEDELLELLLDELLEEDELDDELELLDEEEPTGPVYSSAPIS